MGTRLRILSANLLNGSADPASLADVVEAWEAQRKGSDQAATFSG